MLGARRKVPANNGLHQRIEKMNSACEVVLLQVLEQLERVIGRHDTVLGVDRLVGRKH